LPVPPRDFHQKYEGVLGNLPRKRHGLIDRLIIYKWHVVVDGVPAFSSPFPDTIKLNRKGFPIIPHPRRIPAKVDLLIALNMYNSRNVVA
jgi:hypothetical protein